MSNQNCYDEISRLFPKAVEAMQLLHKVTGKRGVADIRPLEEKRWSERCWEAYSTLVHLQDMLVYGKHWQEVEADILRELTPTDGWVGQVPTTDWSCSEPVTKRVKKLFSGCALKPCDPTRKDGAA